MNQRIKRYFNEKTGENKEMKQIISRTTCQDLVRIIGEGLSHVAYEKRELFWQHEKKKKI